MERKLSTKRPELCEKSQSGGCMWGLIGILDFCQGNSKRKLLSDGRHLNRHVVGTGNSRSRLKLLPNFDEKCQEIDDGANKKSLTVDVGERSVKKFIEEEMSTEQHISKQATSTELKHIESDSGLFGHLAKNHKKSSKTCQRAYQLPAQDRKDVVSVGHQEPSFPSSMETSSDKLNLAAMLEAFCNETHHENGRQCGNEQRSISCARYDELNEINLQLDGANHQSKHFLDAFEILNANKEVFLELLQDPNSLLSKHIQHLLNSPTEKEKTESVSEAKFLECGINNPRNCEEAACNVKFRKQNMHNFLKKIKSRYGYLSKESDDPQHSNRIVVLKSGRKGMQNSENVTCHCSSLQSHHNLRIKGQSAKSCTDVKSKDKLSKPRDSESSIGPQCATISESVHKKLNMSTVSYSKKREIDIYLEAKRHLSERLSKVDEGDTFSSKHAPRTLGWMLSLPEHEFWATLSPKRDMEHGSASAQMRFSSSSNFQMANESSWQLQKEKKMSYPSPLRQNVEVPPCTDTSKPDGQLQIFDSKPSSPENFIPDTKFHNNICSTRDDLTSKGCVKNGETNDILQAGDFYLLELPSESNRTLVASGKQSIDAMNTCEEIQHLKCLRSVKFFILSNI
uniref:DUF3741 domain-containing protein n=1 Tax=Davidia involucrata TaxID=16924 RepID=A0A5B6ZUB4_DAVIN